MNALRTFYARRTRERGSMAVELAVLAPVMLLLIGVIVVGGRFAVANSAMSGVAGAAARDASIARNAAVARQSATTTATQTLLDQNLHCIGSPVVDVDVDGFSQPADSTPIVTVQVSCVVEVNGFRLPGLPATRTVTDRASSPIDPYRSTP